MKSDMNSALILDCTFIVLILACFAAYLKHGDPMAFYTGLVLIMILVQISCADAVVKRLQRIVELFEEEEEVEEDDVND